MIFYTFTGSLRSHTAHPHESPQVMTVPLIVLAAFSGVIGLVGAPWPLVGNMFHRFVHFEAAEGAPFDLRFAALSTAIAGAGILAAAVVYRWQLVSSATLRRVLAPVYAVLVHKHWWDGLYAVSVVRPVVWVAQQLRTVDVYAIDVAEGDRPGRLAGIVRPLAVHDGLVQDRRRVPVSRAGQLDPQPRHSLPSRRGWIEPAPDRAHGPAEPAVGRLLLADRAAVEGISVPLSAAGDRDAGSLCRAGLLPLLYLLGDHPGAYVFPHRHLGRPAQGIRGHQVLPVYAGGIAGHAPGDPGDVLQCAAAHVQHADADRAAAAGRQTRAGRASLLGILPQLRDQGADVALSHLAARRARGGADGRERHPGRRAPEDGDVWVRAGEFAHVARGVPHLRAGGGRAGPAGDRVRRARGHGPDRPEEAGRLQLGQPHGLRDARRRVRRGGRRHPGEGRRRRYRAQRGGLRNGGSRRHHGRAVLDRRGAL